MSEPQDRVLDLRSVFGLQGTVTTPSAATGGAYVEMGVALDPGGHTNNHLHPEQEETFDVLEGTLEVFHDGGWHAIPAGASLTVPRGVVHAFRNATDRPVRFRNVHRPALTFQEFLETVDRLIRAGKVKGRKGLRSGIYLSMASVERDTSVNKKPPQFILRGLAFIGRLLRFTLN
jgi:quercetin dioxygenase-like cupin family protein